MDNVTSKLPSLDRDGVGREAIVKMDAQTKPLRLSNWEYIVPALAIASLLASCIIVSSKKYFWNDELHTYYLLSDGSFRHMMVAFSDKFTNVPPLYFVLGWLWAKAFGATELSLRLFSSLGMSIACLVTWITLRRNFRFWPAAIGTLGIFCMSHLILTQNAEARMYGLFLAAWALGVLQFDVINQRQQCSRGALVLNALIHVAIIQTHLFGIMYSGVILCAFIIRDRHLKVFRPSVYSSIVVSWLSLILYLPTFLNQADAGKPRTWIPVPKLHHLITSFVPTDTIWMPAHEVLAIVASTSFPLVIALLLIVSAMQFVWMSADSRHIPLGEPRSRESAPEASLLILACLCLAVPVGVWIISRTIQPIFVLRYMIPSVQAWSILLAYLSSRMIQPPEWRLLRRSGRRPPPLLLLPLMVLMLVLIMYPAWYARGFPKEQFPGISDGKYGYQNLPVVLPLSHDFMKRFHYSPERQRYFFLLDWESALNINSGLFSPQEYKAMDALKRNYRVFDGNIVQIREFLRMHDRFLVLVLDDIDSRGFHSARWLETRIKDSPDYKVTALGVVDGRQLLLVEKQVEGATRSSRMAEP
jgi:Dolichyl-phosphate-mannose-protein mannosyltransferase